MVSSVVSAARARLKTKGAKGCVMYQFFVEPCQINIEDKRVVILGGDVNHVKNVLRMRVGEEISVSNGLDGREYRCGIAALEEDRVVCELRFIREEQVELPAEVYLFQGLPKGDKMELIVQKTVELGVCKIVPVAMKRCIAKLEDRKAQSRVARWQGIAEAAAKQSRRGILPEVLGVVSFPDAVKMASDMEVKLVPYEMARDMGRTREILGGLKPGQRIAVFIGPEGGFEEAEIELARNSGMEPITLGRRILRTETAGLTVLAWIGYVLGV